MRALKKKVKAAWGWFLALLEAPRYYFAIVKVGWWKIPPFLPLTTKRYIKFRLDTAYGMVENGWKRPSKREMVVAVKNFLLWRREMRIGMKRKRSAGWTLIEVMIVVIIIIALVSVVVANKDHFSITERMERNYPTVECFQWNKLCLCEVGKLKWGFVAPPETEACAK